MQNFNNFLESVHYLNHPILSGFVAVLMLSLGFFVLFKKIKSTPFRAFFWMSLILFIWFFGNALSMFYFYDLDYSFRWMQIAYTAVPFMGVSYYYFSLTLIKKKDKIIYPFLLISILEVYYLWFLNDGKNEFYTLPNVGVVWPEIIPYTYPFIFGMVKYFILSIMTALTFFNSYRDEIDFIKKKQFKFLSVIFFVISLGVIEWLVIFDIPLHIAWMLIPFFVGMVAYSILKYQFMEIKIIVKKALFYSIGIAIASGGIVGVSFLSGWLTENIKGFKFWVIPLFAGIASFIIGNIFWRKSKEVEKLKYEFITVAAHKLRTPLTDIKWAASYLRDKEISDREKDKLLKEIISADERLIDLTNELLSVARAETNQYRYNLETVDFEKVIRKNVNDFQLQMKEKGIRFFYNAEKNLPKVKIDKIRISSVAQTLIENSILYTKNEIKINIDVYKNNIIFHIEDNGIGVPKEDQKNIFSKFYRTSEAFLTETEGAGLDLFLAKSIIEKHNGKIGVRSEGKGKGSVFWFSLPIN